MSVPSRSTTPVYTREQLSEYIGKYVVVTCPTMFDDHKIESLGGYVETVDQWLVVDWGYGVWVDSIMSIELACPLTFCSRPLNEPCWTSGPHPYDIPMPVYND